MRVISAFFISVFFAGCGSHSSTCLRPSYGENEVMDICGSLSLSALDGLHMSKAAERQWLIQLNIDLLSSDPEIAVLELPDGQAVEFERRVFVRHSSNNFSWSGRDQSGNRAGFGLLHGEAVGSIRHGADYYTVVEVEPGIALVRYEPEKLPGHVRDMVIPGH